MSQVETLGYSVTIHNPIVVVLFSGMFNVRCVEALEKCKTEIKQISEIADVVVDFSNVSKFTLDGVPAFTQFQKCIRDRKLQLRLCGLSDELRTKLVNLGVIRQGEVSPTLKDSLILIKKGVRSNPLALEVKRRAA